MLSNSIHIGRRGVSVSGGSSAPLWYLAGGAPAPVAAYQPKGAASLAASYVNLANPGTYDAAPGVAPTWAAATGWTFNGTTQNLAMGILVTGTSTIIARFANATNDGYVLGASQGVLARLAVSPRRGAGTIVRYLYGAAGIADISPGLAAGVLALAGPNRYRNGAADGSYSSETFASVYGMLIGAAADAAGAAFAFFAGDIIAVSIYSSTLTAGQVAAVSTAMAAL